MVQLTWFAVPCIILLVISLISFNYWLSLVTGSLYAFLIIALIVKIGMINNEKIDSTWKTKKIAELEHQIKE
jgi:hypothetical protein